MTSDMFDVDVECWGCDGMGKRIDTHLPTGWRVSCGWCRGTGRTLVTVGCDHSDGSWTGYGDADDSQWDGAWSCDVCEAVFAEWPRAAPWPPKPVDPATCACSHRRADHRRFSDDCIALECACDRYAELESEVTS